MISETPENRGNQFSVTAAAGHDGAAAVAVEVDAEKNGTVPVGTQHLVAVFRQDVVKCVESEYVFAAGKKQQVHQKPDEQTAR